jgi:hypothetical protein
MGRTIRIVAAASLIAAVSLFSFYDYALGASVTVDTTSDVSDGDTTSITNLIADPGGDGQISLREAILAAVNTPGADTINFNIPGCGGACTITPTTSDLPMLMNGSTTIDGYTQPGSAYASGGTPAVIMIELDGSSPATTIGLQIASSGNVIKGLAINRFNTGIKINGSSATANTIEGCHIGTNPLGDVPLANINDGVLISLTADTNTIGGDEAKERNVISGNGRDGIRLEDFTTQDNLILGNYIGVDAYGTGPLGNTQNGITIWSSASSNFVGGTAPGEGNVISSNGVDGIALNGSGVTGHEIQNNYIGLASDGLGMLPNGQNGIQVINGAYSNTIGSSSPGAGNVISANGASGIQLTGGATRLNAIEGNLIGTDLSGTLDRGNSSEGVRISSDAHDNTVGGDIVGKRNIISGNGMGGVRILSIGASNNIISGNYIGTDISGTVALGNSFDGVSILSAARFNIVGGDTQAEGNLISGNAGSGVSLFGAGTTSNTLSSNYIGTDVTGTLALPNAQGINLGDFAHDTMIGSYVLGAGNLISGNSLYGVRLYGGASSNTLAGNYIGTDAAGTDYLMNGSHGVLLESGAANNTIGGGGPNVGNVISANDGSGVRLEDADTQNNTIAGNLIGLDTTGLASLGNTLNGVALDLGANNNTIGGTSSGYRNIISGNGTSGVEIKGTGTDSNTILGNYIGLGSDGLTDLGNSSEGVYLVNGPQLNTIGSTFFAARNIVSGNDGNGILMQGTDTAFNEIIGNYVGTDPAGSLARENGAAGIALGLGAHDNNVGGDLPGEGNLISGNHFSGVDITGTGVSANTVAGNYIGTDYTGLSDLGNGTIGVSLAGGAAGNTIGGLTAGSRNIISGNGTYGVGVSGTGSNSNTIQGNYIGTDITGASALPNDSTGVSIWFGAQSNIIGGHVSGAGNVISGNLGTGVALEGNGTNDNHVEGNIIGLDYTGTSDLGNGYNGVLITFSASNNTIGGDSADKRNIISGNAQHGVAIINVMTSGNVVSGNFIGTDISGTIDLGNDFRGVDLANGACNSVIGGDSLAERNVISGNNDGIFVSGSGTDSNVIKRNLIGTEPNGTLALPNGNLGVYIYNGAQDNVIGPGNVIAFNGSLGVHVAGGTTFGNVITQNSIHDNSGAGIGLSSGANGGILAPTISGAAMGPVTISGTATSCDGCTIEVFSNPDMDGEGKTYLGSTTVVGTTWSLSLGCFSDPYLTATATDATDGTSEFSSVFTTPLKCLFLPLIMR